LMAGMPAGPSHLPVRVPLLSKPQPE